MSDKNILDKAADAAKDAYDSAAQGLKNIKEKIVGEPSTEDKIADKISDSAHSAADKIGEWRDAAHEKKEDASDKCHELKKDAGDKFKEIGDNLKHN
ncbi:hypothetical protein M3Y97_00136200 [Aphelenchoides bicaudatus]|nr:hypothetical protein M3Y97_00136200 [Aphelenchoides bicaudatus]